MKKLFVTLDEHTEFTFNDHRSRDKHASDTFVHETQNKTKQRMFRFEVSRKDTFHGSVK